MKAPIPPLPDSIIDDMEVGRCSCGIVFYSTEYQHHHLCVGHPDGDDPWYGGNPPDGAL